MYPPTLVLTTRLHVPFHLGPILLIHTVFVSLILNIEGWPSEAQGLSSRKFFLCGSKKGKERMPVYVFISVLALSTTFI